MSILLAILASAPLSPDLTPETPQVESPETERPQILTPGEMFDLADRAVRAGNLRFAETILVALTDNPDRKFRNEARFRLAMLYRSSKRDREAAQTLRRILDEEPSAGRVRIELAATLQALGETSAAQKELRALRSTQLPPNVARFVDRLSASIQATKPLGIMLEVAIAPDSNIARATDRTTLDTVFGEFDINEDGKDRSGIGFALRGLVTSRVPVTETVDFTTRFSGRANLYRVSDFNEISLELSAGPEMKLGRSRLSIDAAVGQSWYGMEPYQRSARFGFGTAMPIGATSQLRIDTSLALLDNRVNDLQDGYSVSGLLRFERAFSPRFLISTTAGAARYEAEDDAYSNRSWNIGMTAYREIGRMTLISGLDYGELVADERLILLPRARKDRTVRGNVGVVFRQVDFMGFSPLARIVVEKSRSTVEFYDYSRTRAEMGFSRAF